VLDRQAVLEARAAIGDRLLHTPTLRSRALAAHLKCELFQRTGSFKPRGVLNKLRSLTDEERRRGVIAVSAGNHAQAVAFGAAAAKIDALVVMWQGASEQKLAATRAYGAEIDLAAADPRGAFDRLDELIAETGRTLVHPFDDPVVVAGAGTLALEIEEDVPDADAIVVPVGGGGLVAGIVAAVGHRKRVVAVEPELSQALHAGLAARKPVLVEPASIADGLNAPFTGRLAIEACSSLERALVSEEEIKEAFRFLYERAKLACEPAGAVAVAALLAGKIDAERPVAIVTGGNVAREIASGILTGE
jgi:threonine dehydratase